MNIELNRLTFRRLVQLYLCSLVVAVVAIAVEMSVWSDFIDDFDSLTVEHFGESSDTQMLDRKSTRLNSSHQ